MAAHELGHRQRYRSGAWHGMPAGFVAQESAALDPASLAAWAEMQAARREEGYRDLVGLDLTERHHAPLYARLHGWLLALRSPRWYDSAVTSPALNMRLPASSRV